MRRTQYLILFMISLFLLTSVFSIFILDTDGLGVREEFEHNTNPFTADTDGDGLTDSMEVNKYNTSPTDIDSDNDGIKDGHEINKYNTNPLEADTDNDGLTDFEEIVTYNTSPTNPDTDGDSISDGAEVYNTKDYPNADPLQKDVYIEVDYAVSYNQSEVNNILAPVKEMYMDAPVDNPDGTTGINLHTQVDNTSVSNKYMDVTRTQHNYSPNSSGLFGNDLENHTTVYTKINVSDYTMKIKSSFENKNKSGYYQVTYVDFICRNGEDCMSVANGMAYIYNNSTVVATDNPSTTAHELGHLFGLLHSEYYGVDSEKVHPSKYPSVMNYNYNKHSPFDEYEEDEYNYTLQYSNGKGFNDWKEINQTIANDTRTSPCNCST